jgi:transposase
LAASDPEQYTAGRNSRFFRGTAGGDASLLSKTCIGAHNSRTLLGRVQANKQFDSKMFEGWKITEEQYVRIKDSLPIQRGNVRLSNLQVLNAILYVAEQGCKWRGLPKRFGRWHTVYMRMNRWAKNGVLDRVFEQLQLEQIVRIRIEEFSLDSTSVKVHPDGTGALKKNGPQAIGNPEADGTPKFIWLPRILERL